MDVVCSTLQSDDRIFPTGRLIPTPTTDQRSKIYSEAGEPGELIGWRKTTLSVFYNYLTILYK